MKKININCDVGEGVNNESLLMPFINECNIACGGHAGSKEIMERVVDYAILNNVKIGAHPSYPDKENFGRKTLKISDNDLINSIQNQVQLLSTICIERGVNLHHIKAHGALYNDIAKDKKLAKIYLKAIESFKNKLFLFVPFNSEIENEAVNQEFKIIYEAFGDRNYNENLSLVSRLETNAVLINYNQIIKHISTIVSTNKVLTKTGKLVSIKAETFCLHSDTANVVENAKKIHNYFNK